MSKPGKHIMINLYLKTDTNQVSGLSSINNINQVYCKWFFTGLQMLYQGLELILLQ